MAAKTWDEVYGEGAYKGEYTPNESLTMEAIAAMPRAELVSLVQRMSAQCGYIPTLTQEQTAQAMLDTLAALALRPIVAGTDMRADINSRMTAIDKWLDRTRGKAVQTLQVDQRITHNTLAVHMTSEQLDREIARLRGDKPLMIDVTPES